VTLGRDRERQVGGGRDDERRGQLLDPVAELNGRQVAREALQDDRAAPHDQCQRQDREDPCGQGSDPGSGEHRQPEPDPEDRDQAVSRDLELLRVWHDGGLRGEVTDVAEY
jgi:hypothetical protein